MELRICGTFADLRFDLYAFILSTGHSDRPVTLATAIFATFFGFGRQKLPDEQAEPVNLYSVPELAASCPSD